MSTTLNRLASGAKHRMRVRRDNRQFLRAYDNASPAMQAELLAAAQRTTFTR